MKILVTGATGFAGSHLLEALRDAGYTDIYGTAYRPVTEDFPYLSKDRIIPVDLTKQEDTEKVIEQIKPDWVFHLAAFAFVGESFNRASEVMYNNVTLQLNVLRAVHTYVPNARVLIIGSAEEYGLSEEGEVPIKEDHPLRPVNPYSVSKITQDLLGYAFAVSYHLNILRVRPFNHIGERQTPDFAVPAFCKQIVDIERGKQKSIKVGNLSGIRDFTDVKDMVRAYITVMEKGDPKEVYNIGSGVGVSMKDIVDMLVNMSTVKIEIEQDESRMRPLDIAKIIADTSKMQQLGWKPTIPLQETLTRTLEYWRRREE